ncbi:PPA1309 family protein [Amycolatopsis sp. CA-230715]|uniref:PPA1309 family protein n=1 Tax=Amycolatopsis sp. CA-230715 TaxID=2745196 RepID=UPI001C0262F4|nr:PPA1309 family protein [Amycolatopsis sp. CA-230715]QWF79033.1 hypothetical protein HUW46_02437 [Amycolatopsis sp. CA-230715]
MESSAEEVPGTAVANLAREVEEFVASGGWDQQPQLFALVPTETLLAEQPELAGQLGEPGTLTPVAQEPLPEGDLADSLARIAWPDVVAGCALAQEIIVLPPEAEADLPTAEQDDAQRLRQAAADHPQRTEARLVAAVVRGDGPGACVMRLRGAAEGDAVDEIIEHPELAPNLVDALRATLAP